MFKDGKELPDQNHAVPFDASFYREIGIDESHYMAIPALDKPEFDLSVFFEEATRFIDSAIDPIPSTQTNSKSATNSDLLRQNGAKGGKVLVHCVMGVSRSATIVMAYLLLRRRDAFPSLDEAIRFVKVCRDIDPNSGFLKQLLQLECRLRTSRQSSELRRVEQSKESANSSLVEGYHSNLNRMRNEIKAQEIEQKQPLLSTLDSQTVEEIPSAAAATTTTKTTAAATKVRNNV